MTQTNTKTYIITGPGIARQEVEARGPYEAVKAWAKQGNVEEAHAFVREHSAKTALHYTVVPGLDGPTVSYIGEEVWSKNSSWEPWPLVPPPWDFRPL